MKHGSRPVPSGALAGALGAGMTSECGAIVATNAIPAQAWARETAQR